MPRKPRKLSSTGIYHIILRSVNQHIIFEDDSDYRKFLHILSDSKSKHDIDIYAYCLMDNHIHLLLRSSPNNLPSFFQSFGSKFVRWYNNKYSRSGHLFQDRYHSRAVENKKQYLSTLLYIHNNPVKANICQYPSEYRWSSYNAFYGAKNPLIDTSFSHEIAGSKDNLLHYFAINSDAEDELEYELFADDHHEVAHFVSDEKALELFKKVTGLSSASDVCKLGKPTRNQFIRELRQKKLTVNQIARIMDISPSTIKRV